MNKKVVLVVAALLLIIPLGIWIVTIIIKEDNNAQHSDKSSVTTEEAPDESTRLIFIHHSTGENWLSDSDGGLGIALRDNNYFVSDTNYGWGPDYSFGIGDRTDIGNWWEWFRGPQSEEVMDAIYRETEQYSEYSRLSDTPNEENVIIMFKSCFPNSNLMGDQDDPIPDIEDNPLKYQSSDSEYHTVANAKGIYLDILNYFEEHQDKLFVVITAPPLGRNNTESAQANNARHFNDWLVNDWLDDYNYNNVVVFDFYDVLTDHGVSNYSEYSTDDSDDHPNAEGNQMATEEFIPFLNSAYQDWSN